LNIDVSGKNFVPVLIVEYWRNL